MCGRYYNRDEKQRIAEAMHTKVPRCNIAPSYNVAPPDLPAGHMFESRDR